ncbi:glycosyltransferase family 4 protein [Myxosarcina sp. GI1(2024)]
MKIAYVTTYDSSNIKNWSGLGYYIHSALRSHDIQTETIDNLIDKNHVTFGLKQKLYSKIFSKRYLKTREPMFLKDYAAQVDSALANINYDVVFSPGTIPIAYLQTNKPIVFWADATFAGMVNFYPGYSNLCAETIAKGNKMEQLALSKCRLAIYSSEWAANTAIENYDVDSNKVKVVPFGANINCKRNFHDINLLVENKQFDICKLLFVGVDWTRKGGDTALRVAELLNKRGIKTELHVVGCKPQVEFIPSFVKLHGFVSKATDKGREILDRLYSESHFFILPSRAECYGVVFAEASSFGLPSLATKVGGITTAVKERKNGYTFSLDESPEKYCVFIEEFMSSKQKYAELAASSFTEYSKNLNWSCSGKKVYELLQEFCH